MFKTRDRHFGYILLLGFVSISQTAAMAEDEKRVVMSPVADRVRTWFPADTETIVAAFSFPMPATRAFEEGPIDFITFARTLACGEVADLAKGKFLKPLIGKKVALAMRGGRHFETVTKFGSHRSEGCAVVIFENELGDAGRDWTDLLRKDAKEVRTIVGREVFVYPSTVVMHSIYRPHPWQATYLMLLRPDTLLCATSDVYLEEVLKRVDGQPADRALPESLPEWKHIHPMASSWMLRHIPPANDKRIIDGLTWSMKKDGVEIVYLPVADSAGRVEEAANFRWGSAGLEKLLQAKDGTVIVSLSTLSSRTEIPDPNAWSTALFLYALQNESGAVGAQ